MAGLAGLGRGRRNGDVAMRFEVPGPSVEGEPARRRPILRFRPSTHLWRPPTYKIRQSWFLGLNQRGNFRGRNSWNSVRRGYLESDRPTRSVTLRDHMPVVRRLTVKNHAENPVLRLQGRMQETGSAQ